MFRGQSAGFFFKINFFTNVQPQKKSEFNQFLICCHEIWHNDRTLATDLNCVGEFTNYLQIIVLWIILFASLLRILQFYRTNDKRRLTWTNKNRRHGINIHTLLKLARWQMIAESENWATWDFVKDNFRWKNNAAFFAYNKGPIVYYVAGGGGAVVSEGGGTILFTILGGGGGGYIFLRLVFSNSGVTDVSFCSTSNIT